MSALPAGYAEFLDNKRASAPLSGFDPGDEVSDVLFGFQRAIVRWAVAGGRRAIFAAFGLGKSLMQLEAVRLVLAHDGGRGLIVCPLGVRQEFARDARLLGVEASFVRRSEEVSADGIYLTNYESVRDGRLDPGLFDVASLDEASVLRSFGSKTYQTFLGLFDQVPYRFVATATPSPNRYKELIHYAGFLGIMDTGQALTRFFQRDSTKANNLTLYPHKEREFWLWLASWAVFVQRPSDLGYSDAGYDLPPIDAETNDRLADWYERSRADLRADGFRRTASTPLFAREDGSPYLPSMVYAGFSAMAREVGLDPAAHFHTLRHTHATYLLDQGVSIRVLQERLGHSSVNVTLQIYGHVLPGRDEAAAEAYGELRGAARRWPGAAS